MPLRAATKLYWTCFYFANCRQFASRKISEHQAFFGESIGSRAVLGGDWGRFPALVGLGADPEDMAWDCNDVC